MGFFFGQTKEQAAKSRTASKKHIPVESMNKLGCKACPRAKDKNPPEKLHPEGSEHPLLYILGESPGEKERHPFDSEEGDLLKSQFTSKELKHDIRLGYSVRCYSGNAPGQAEIECCRNQVIEDIERTKPLVIIGTGNLALSWATGITGGVTKWRGRLIATKIGNHSCWFLPVYQAEFVLRKKKGKKYGKSEHEMVFERDIQDLLKNLPDEPPVIYEGPYDEGIQYVMGEDGRKDLIALKDSLDRIARYPEIAIDLETSNLRPYMDGAKIYTVAVGTFNDTLVFPLDHPEAWNESQRVEVWKMFIEFLLYSGTKIAHFLPLEMEWLAYLIDTRLLRLVEWGDTYLLSHTLDETPGTHDLDTLIREKFGFFLKSQSRVDPVRLLEFPLREALRYNAMDTKWTFLFYEKTLPAVKANPKFLYEYERKLKLSATLILTQIKGVPVDLTFAEKMHDTLNKETKAIESKISRCPEVIQYNKMFPRFEPTNPDNVLKLMRDICKREEVNVSNRDGTTKQSTDEEVLSSIDEPSASLILEHRAVSKLQSTYIIPTITKKIISDDGLIHTRYSSTTAVTGRLASSDPNLQNFPKRKRKEVRGIVAAPDGSWFVAADYGQIEARVFGMASEDRRLVEYLWTGYDIHGYWADRFMKEYSPIESRIISEYGVDGDDKKKIRKTFRDEIKNGWVFPQFFGSSVKSCSGNLKVPEDIANDLANEFWSEFEGVKKWQDKLLRSYEKNLYVETLSGRRRRGAMTKNELLNHPIQGTAADIVTEGMNALSERAMLEWNEELQPIMNIHDDLPTICLDENLENTMEIMAYEMCMHRFDFINVPLVVEISVGPRWSELEEVKVYRSDEMFGLRKP